MLIFIDDERTPDTSDVDERLILLRTSQEAAAFFADVYVAWFWFNIPTEITRIWFDHDLGEDSENNGLWVARFVKALMAETAFLADTSVFVHSQNPVGAKNIVDAFSGSNKAVRVPLPKLVTD